MKGNNFLPLTLFVLGALLVISCAGITTWGDMEAAMFDVTRTPDEFLNLRCPIIMTKAETATVSAVLHNPSQWPAQFPAWARISQGSASFMREERVQIVLAPGERQKLAWTVGPEDAAFGRVILVRVHALRSGELPYRAGACGIVVVDLPFPNGNLFFGLLVTAGLLCAGGGMALWALAERPLWGKRLAVIRLMGTLAGFLVGALVVSILGMWFFGLVLILLTLLLIGSIVGFAFTS